MPFPGIDWLWANKKRKACASLFKVKIRLISWLFTNVGRGEVMSLLARSDFPNAFEFVFQGFSFQSNERMKAELIKTFFLKKWDKPGLFFIYFQSFQTNKTIFSTNQCVKISCPSSIRCRDSNQRPSEHESPPITTRPGLPPKLIKTLSLSLLFSDWSLPV